MISTKLSIPMLALCIGACTPRAISISADHPASPEAPVGRLAGPPPALRPGVAAAGSEEASAPPEATPVDHSHHQAPAQSAQPPGAPKPREEHPHPEGHAR